MRGVDCIKIADNHDIKEKTAGKVEGIEPLWLHICHFLYNVTVSSTNHLILSIFIHCITVKN